MTIEILFVPGCPGLHEAERMTREVLAELELDVPVVLELVRDLDTATRLGFTGSPTIRVDGRDVVPVSPLAQPAVACRLYATGSGLTAAPDRASIRTAILRGIR